MEVVIDNYKNIHNKRFNIINNKLILVGKNGIGKTNVLEAIDEEEFKIIGAKREYKDIFYIKSELYVNEEIKKGRDSDFIKMFELAYGSKLESVSDAYKLVNEDLCEVQDIHQSSYPCKGELDSNDGGLGTGFKRRVIHQMVKELTVSDSEDRYIILMDCPESSAHPSMIRKMCIELNVLAKMGHLVIVATHSDTVVEFLYDDISQIAKLSFDDKLIVRQLRLSEYTSKIRNYYNTKNIFKLPNGKSNEALVAIIKNDLDSFCKSILHGKTFKILFADLLLVGEGASEDIMFDYIFSKEINSKLLSMNVDYFTSFGKFYLPFFFILANMYDVKVVCIYDVDKPENKSHKAFNGSFKKYEAENRKMFYALEMVPDLESELGIEMARHRVEKPLHIYNALYKKNSDIADIVKRIEKAVEILY